MKSKIQMQVAKHMIAVWIDVNSKKESLTDAYDTIDRCWPQLARRVLRTWAKTLHKNPERYEFTGYAFSKTELKDHFYKDEISFIETLLDSLPTVNKTNYNDVVRSIIHHKWVYGMDTFTSVEHGIASYFNNRTEPRFNRKYRPAKPVLKS